MDVENHEIKLAGSWALNLLAQKSPEEWEYREARAQFKKAAEICRRRIEEMNPLLEVPTQISESKPHRPDRPI